jgi:glyoxylase-like metal-dependent hydrolase (beta-lactamase superfamily II)
LSQIPLSPSAATGDRVNEPAGDHALIQIAPDLAYRQLAIVNVIFFGLPGAGDGRWVLIDTGIAGFGSVIRDSARSRFGQTGKPECIIMTHGHFDHVGTLETLSSEWDVPVYAHPLEQPYLNGQQSYPPADPAVGGGLIAKLSRFFPTQPVDVRVRLHSLPADHSVPGMSGWRWIHTPGHSAGHISLWRETDRMLVAGDAVVTTAQESVYSSLTQKPEMHGPPMYFTPDWRAARNSVQTLASLSPETLITGHGAAMHGPEMRRALTALAERFDEVAVPAQVRSVC